MTFHDISDCTLLTPVSFSLSLSLSSTDITTGRGRSVVSYYILYIIIKNIITKCM